MRSTPESSYSHRNVTRPSSDKLTEALSSSCSLSRKEAASSIVRRALETYSCSTLRTSSARISSANERATHVFAATPSEIWWELDTTFSTEAGAQTVKSRKDTFGLKQ